MEEIKECLICRGSSLEYMFQKRSNKGEIFNLVKCSLCGLQFISPRPTEEGIIKYYTREYFTRRTDRGYDNYFSNNVKDEIERVINLNLYDLDFFQI